MVPIMEEAYRYVPNPAGARAKRTLNKRVRWMAEMRDDDWSVLNGMSYEALASLRDAVTERCNDLGMAK